VKSTNMRLFLAAVTIISLSWLSTKVSAATNPSVICASFFGNRNGCESNKPYCAYDGCTGNCNLVCFDQNTEPKCLGSGYPIKSGCIWTAGGNPPCKSIGSGTLVIFHESCFKNKDLQICGTVAGCSWDGTNCNSVCPAKNSSSQSQCVGSVKQGCTWDAASNLCKLSHFRSLFIFQIAVAWKNHST